MNSVALLLPELVCGAAGLAIGWFLGRFWSRRGAGRQALETQRVRHWLGEFSQWTSCFEREVATYREEMQGLTELAEDISQTAAPSASAAGLRPETRALQLLGRIVAANRRLQHRLDEAEDQLHRQADELKDYLSEARTDNLTDLPNRRALDEELGRRLAEWRRYRAPFSLALLDIDHFKEINDRFGHVAGDQVLGEVARSLRAAMRDADLVARFGGEEFAVVMPATGEPALFRAAERAREAVEGLVLTIDGQEIRPTASCGAAQVRETDDVATLLQRADAALYSAKYAGRNQSHWHDGRRCRSIYGAPLYRSAPEEAEAETETPEHATA